MHLIWVQRVIGSNPVTPTDKNQYLIFNYIVKIMEPSIKCYNWIASKEGWRNNTYQDSVGIWTIGLGVRNDGFKYGKSISNERVIELFLQHVKSNASDVIKKWKKYLIEVGFNFN